MRAMANNNLKSCARSCQYSVTAGDFYEESVQTANSHVENSEYGRQSSVTVNNLLKQQMRLQHFIKEQSQSMTFTNSESSQQYSVTVNDLQAEKAILKI
jgi:hypothetical protein